jgi:hypothetical protein
MISDGVRWNDADGLAADAAGVDGVTRGSMLPGLTTGRLGVAAIPVLVPGTFAGGSLRGGMISDGVRWNDADGPAADAAGVDGITRGSTLPGLTTGPLGLAEIAVLVSGAFASESTWG